MIANFLEGKRISVLFDFLAGSNIQPMTLLVEKQSGYFHVRVSQASASDCDVDYLASPHLYRLDTLMIRNAGFARGDAVVVPECMAGNRLWGLVERYTNNGHVKLASLVIFPHGERHVYRRDDKLQLLKVPECCFSIEFAEWVGKIRNNWGVVKADTPPRRRYKVS